MDEEIIAEMHAKLQGSASDNAVQLQAWKQQLKESYDMVLGQRIWK
jgi:hypothetical protein